MPPKKKGKKKKKDDAELALDENYKRTLDEIEALKDHLAKRYDILNLQSQYSQWEPAHHLVAFGLWLFDCELWCSIRSFIPYDKKPGSYYQGNS